MLVSLKKMNELIKLHTCLDETVRLWQASGVATLPFSSDYLFSEKQTSGQGIFVSKTRQISKRNGNPVSHSALQITGRLHSLVGQIMMMMTYSISRMQIITIEMAAPI